jgi:lysyl-tRNA synthetase class 2
MLKLRAQLLAKIRDFFASRNVLEAVTPLLCQTTITAPYLHSLTTQYHFPGDHKNSKILYLQTSPEFAMKKLIANGSGDIYQICKAFRDEELGRLHNFEFTILEWYRIGFDHHKLMDEMNEFLQFTLNTKKVERLSYAEAFAKYLQIDCFNTSSEILQKCAHEKGLQNNNNLKNEDIDTWLQLLFSYFIEPNLGEDQPTFIYDYPASQSALAKINKSNPKVSSRFEVYINGIELANGFHELNDAKEQKERFLADQKKRVTLGLPEIAIDEEFINAVGQLPNCAGVALGVDRLLLLLVNANSLEEIL